MQKLLKQILYLKIVLHGVSAITFTLSYVLILSVFSTLFFDADTPLIEFIVRYIFLSTASNLLVYLPIAVCGYMLVFYRQTKNDESIKHEMDIKNRELEKQVVDFKLSTLKMQIQPHWT